MSDLNYVTDDTRDDLILSDDDLDKSEEERAPYVDDAYLCYSSDTYACDASDGTDDSNAYVCEGLDEPNYISADHCYYPDLSA
jgi:hypothetical protein